MKEDNSEKDLTNEIFLFLELKLKKKNLTRSQNVAKIEGNFT